MRLAAAALLLAASALPAAAQDGPLVTVSGGEVRGAEQDGALVFRGIPYAAPPLSELRWKPPQPASAWNAVRDAAERAPACPQTSEGWNEAEAARWSEDCLTLDIRSPSLAGKAPVMVWIHGGSNRAGSSSGPADSDMSAQGVVHVGIQYRLGLLGFLSHPELSAEGGGASGNYALMDQVAALEWVRENIERFGGDPANVTIYGESAGSQDVSLLLAAPSAQGLFHKAILQSGTPGFGLPYRSLPKRRRWATRWDRWRTCEACRWKNCWKRRRVSAIRPATARPWHSCARPWTGRCCRRRLTGLSRGMSRSR